MSEFLRKLGILLLLASIPRSWCSASIAGCLSGDFESQVRCLMGNLMTSAEMAHARTTCKRVQDILQWRWKDAVVLPTGSTVIGLATKTSDTDCHARIPGYHTALQSPTLHQIVTTLQNTTIFTNITTKVFNYGAVQIGVVSFFDAINGQDCDLNIDGFTSPIDSQLRAYYFSLNDKFLALAALVKFFISARFEANKTFSKRLRYSSQLMVIFYLQQKKLAPTVHLLQNPAEINNLRDTHLYRTTSSSCAVSLYQLLEDFFQYYSKFNFARHIISPLIGRPVDRKLLYNVSTIPEEFAQYRSYLLSEGTIPTGLNAPIYVLPVFEQRYNPMEILDDESDHDAAMRFISDVKLIAKKLKEIPKEKFLESIV